MQCEGNIIANNFFIMIFDRKLLSANKNRYKKQFKQSNLLYRAGAEIIIENYHLARSLFKNHTIQDSNAKMLEIGMVEEFFNGFFLSYHKISTSIFSNSPSIFCDDEDLKFDPESFDLVVSNLNLQFINQVPEFLLSVKKLLKPKGLFIATFFGENNLSILRQAILDAQNNKPIAIPIMPPLIDVKSAGMLLQKSGFINPVSNIEKITVDYKNVLSMFRDIKYMSLGNILTKRSKNFFSRDLLAKIEQNYPKNLDGNITANFELVTILGYK